MPGEREPGRQIDLPRAKRQVIAFAACVVKMDMPQLTFMPPVERKIDVTDRMAVPNIQREGKNRTLKQPLDGCFFVRGKPVGVFNRHQKRSAANHAFAKANKR